MSITLVAAGVIVTIAFGRDANVRLLLFLGPLCTATGLLWLDNAHAIFQIGDYIKGELWPRLAKSAGVGDLPNYEAYIFEKVEAVANPKRHPPIIFERGVLIFPFPVIFIAPGIFGTVTVMTSGYRDGWVQALIFISLGLIFFLLIVWIRFFINALARDKSSNSRKSTK